MSYFRKQPYSTKPAGSLRPNLGHPYLQDCRMFHAVLEGGGDTIRDVVRKNHATKEIATTVWTQNGSLALDFQGGGDDDLALSPVVTVATPHTLIAKVNLNAVGDILWGSTNGNVGYGLFYAADDSVWHRQGAVNQRVNIDPLSPAIPTGQDTVLAVRRNVDGKTVDVFVDGVLAGTNSSAAVMEDLVIHNISGCGGGYNIDGLLYWSLVVERAMPATQIAYLCRNGPWAAFDRRILVPTAGEAPPVVDGLPAGSYTLGLTGVNR